MSFLDWLRARHAAAEAQSEIEAVRRIADGLDHLDPARARYLAAFAYLLGRVAGADRRISEIETQAMERIVREFGGLSEAQAVVVVQSPGYMGRLQLVQDLSAVTGLCMLMRKAVFDAVGGFDAALTTGLYRDVDVCSKTREAGWRIVWTPAVTLMYLGSNTQADRPPSSKEVLDDENEQVLDKWLARLSDDPAYNRNLSHIRQDFQVETHTVPDWDPVVDNLPRILGYGVGSYGSWKYRVTQPLEALDEARLAQCKRSQGCP